MCVHHEQFCKTRFHEIGVGHDSRKACRTVTVTYAAIQYGAMEESTCLSRVKANSDSKAFGMLVLICNVYLFQDLKTRVLPVKRGAIS